jgi:hypothetical protein
VTKEDLMDELYGGPMHKMLYGHAAVRVPAWMVVLNHREKGVAIAGASTSSDMLFGGQLTHTFVVGELIVRPHLAVATNKYRGDALDSILQHGETMQSLIEYPGNQVVADPLNIVAKYKIAKGLMG